MPTRKQLPERGVIIAIIIILATMTTILSFLSYHALHALNSCSTLLIALLLVPLTLICAAVLAFCFIDLFTHNHH